MAAARAVQVRAAARRDRGSPTARRVTSLTPRGVVQEAQRGERGRKSRHGGPSRIAGDQGKSRRATDKVVGRRMGGGERARGGDWKWLAGDDEKETGGR